MHKTGIDPNEDVSFSKFDMKAWILSLVCMTLADHSLTYPCQLTADPEPDGTNVNGVGYKVHPFQQEVTKLRLPVLNT